MSQLIKKEKEIRLEICEGEQEIILNHTDEYNGILMYTIETLELNKVVNNSYLSYKEARWLAEELIKWCDEFEKEK